MYLLHGRSFTNVFPFFPQNSASTKCVSRRCSTDSTPTCTPLYLRIVAALMKRIAARCTPNRRAESWNAPCATLTCSTFHTNVPADQITRPGWCASPPSLRTLSLFFFPATRTAAAISSCATLRGSTSRLKRRVHHRRVSNTPYTVSKKIVVNLLSKLPSEEDKMFSSR